MSHKQRRVFWPVLVLAIASLGAWAFISGRPRALRSFGEKKPVEVPRQQPGVREQVGDQTRPAPSSVPDAGAGANKNDRQVTALPIMLKPGGFVPMAITKPAGDFFFSVGNKSGVDELVLRLDRERGGRVREAQVKKERFRWRQTVHLTPGTYLLTEANHPTWVCRIKITPQ